MDNLAGKTNADDKIRMELDGAMIPIEPALAHRSEVPFSIIGKLGDFTFTRAWYYWMVEGPVPIEVAEELYEDPIGRFDIRVAGHCGCPPPAEWATWMTPEGKVVAPAQEEAVWNSIAKSIPSMKATRDNYVFSDDPEGMNAAAFVTSYHIDSLEGLKRFVAALQRHCVVPVTSS